MKSFIILSPIGNCSRDEVDLILRSFEGLHSSVTNKHRKRISLVLITDNDDFQDLIEHYQTTTDKERIKTFSAHEWQLGMFNASILFMPDFIHNPALISESLSKGISILGFNKLPQKQYIDNSCGMLITEQSRESNIAQFASFLRMIYFDPEARKMMQKGAIRRFNLLFGERKGVFAEEFVLSKVA